jgi:hypothetical protein
VLTKNQLTIILFVAALSWAVLLVLSGVPVHPDLLAPFSQVVGVLVLLLTLYDLWLWKLPPFARWLAKRPVLEGTWRGTVDSRWVNLDTGTSAKEIEAYMVIRQTFSSLSMRLYTAESSSQLLGAEITYARDGLCELSGVYRNEPKTAVRQRSPIHHGAILLQIQGRPVTALKGKYWTDRNSGGDIELLQRNAKHAEDFTSAQALFLPPS